MKPTILFGLSLLVIDRQFIQSVNLEQLWKFEEPVLSNNGGLTLTLSHPVSDFIIPRMVTWSLWDIACEEGGNDEVNDYMTSELTSPSNFDPQGDGTGSRLFNVTIHIDSQAISSAPTTIYSYYNQGTKATLQFCVQTALQTMEDKPIMVNWWDTVVIVDFDLTDGFNIEELMISPERNDETADQAYGPEGYWCDPATQERLSDEEILGLGIPGNELSVCIVPNEAARNAGMGLDKVNTFAWVRADATSERLEQAAINDGTTAGDGLTKMACNDNGCGFQSILNVQFFNKTISSENSSKKPSNETAPPPVLPTENTIGAQNTSSWTGCCTFAGEGSDMAIDGNVNTKWTSFTNNPPYLDYILSSPTDVIVTQYEICTANDEPGGDPTTWAVYGCTSSGCTEIQRQNYTTFPDRLTCYRYNVPIPFQLSGATKFRLRILAIRDPSLGLMQISEFSVIGMYRQYRRELSNYDLSSLSMVSNNTVGVPRASSNLRTVTRNVLHDDSETNAHQTALPSVESLFEKVKEDFYRDHDPQRRRQLQTTAVISGLGVATVKFGRRLFRRNLRTGKEGWETYTTTRQRKLQVGGRGAIQLDFEVFLSDPPESSGSKLWGWLPDRSIMTCGALLVATYYIILS